MFHRARPPRPHSRGGCEPRFLPQSRFRSATGGRPWVALAVRGGDSQAVGAPDYGQGFGLVASYVADVNAAEDADDATPPAEAFALVPGHWYRLGTEWTYAAGGEFRYAARIATLALLRTRRTH